MDTLRRSPRLAEKAPAARPTVLDEKAEKKKENEAATAPLPPARRPGFPCYWRLPLYASLPSSLPPLPPLPSLPSSPAEWEVRRSPRLIEKAQHEAYKREEALKDKREEALKAALEATEKSVREYLKNNYNGKSLTFTFSVTVNVDAVPTK